jgi:hypothetical protein
VDGSAERGHGTRHHERGALPAPPPDEPGALHAPLHDEPGALQASTPARDDVDTRILRAVRSLDYGSVEVVVHDSRVVQIERREKLRFDKPAPPDGGGRRSTPGSGRPRRKEPGAE